MKAHPTVPFSLWRALCSKVTLATSKELQVCLQFLSELDIRIEQDLDEVFASVFTSWLEEIDHQPSPQVLQFILSMFLSSLCRFFTVFYLLFIPILEHSPSGTLTDAARDTITALISMASASQEVPKTIVPQQWIGIHQQHLFLEASLLAFVRSTEGMHLLKTFARALGNLEASNHGEDAAWICEARKSLFTSSVAQLSFQNYPSFWASVCLSADDGLSAPVRSIILDSLTRLCHTFCPNGNLRKLVFTL